MVETCKYIKADGGRLGCTVRIENSSGEGVSLADSLPIVFVDNNDQSYVPNDDLSSFNLIPYQTLQSGTTARGQLVLQTIPPKTVQKLQLRVTLTTGGLDNFPLTAEFPYIF